MLELTRVLVLVILTKAGVLFAQSELRKLFYVLSALVFDVYDFIFCCFSCASCETKMHCE